MRYRVLLAAVTGLAVAGLGTGVAVSAPPEAGFTKHTAIELTGSLPITATIDSTNAPHKISRKIGGQSCAAGTDGHVVWFKWTATAGPGPIDVLTTGSAYDTVLYLFEGGKLIACNDDSFSAGATGCPVASGQPRCSFLQFPSVVGTTYYFAVAAFGDSAGGDTHLLVDLD